MIRGYKELAKVLQVSMIKATTIAKIRNLPGTRRILDGKRVFTWDEGDVALWMAQNPKPVINTRDYRSKAYKHDDAKCLIEGCDKMVLHSSGKCMVHRTSVCKCGNRFNVKNYVDSLCGKCKIKVKARDDGSAFNWGR
jgi:hypothetical protein